jgi:ABC-2 type transport system ATP-binding protein
MRVDEQDPAGAVAPGRVGAGPVDAAGVGAAIRTRGLTKRFGPVAVVDEIDLEVPRGSVFGFLGPNGSGKTTTIRMLLGLISPSGGSVELLGEPIPAAIGRALPRVGALVEGPACYPWLTGRQNLARIDAAGPDGRRSTRRDRIEEALHRVGLTAAGDKKFRAYSLGMRQRLGLASAMLRPRDLLVLDEPTNGMDPQGTREIRHLVRDMAADGTTVFVSSHLLAEVEQMCTHVGVMSLGRLVAQTPLTDLRATAVGRVRVETVDTLEAAAVLRDAGLRPTIERSGPAADAPAVEADLDGLVPDELCAALVHAGVRVSGFAVRRPSLEDLFVSLTGEGFDVAR